MIYLCAVTTPLFNPASHPGAPGYAALSLGVCGDVYRS